MSKLALLLQKDFRIIYRDGLNVFVFFFAIVLALAARAVVPLVPIDNFDLYLAPAVMLFAGPMLGTLLGFTLIEEREQNTWLLLRVLPISQVSLFGYIAAASCVLSVVMSLVAAAVYGLPVAEPGRFALMVVAAAPATPLMMLILGAATSNKVEGLALGKIVSSLGIVPALVFVLPAPWQTLLWWHPLYWIYLGFLEAYAGEPRVAELPLYWPGYPFASFVVAPLLLTLVGIVLLARVYRRRAQ